MSPPIDFQGVLDATFGFYAPISFDLNTLLMKLNNASAMTIIVQGVSGGGNPLSDDALELATSMYINQKPAIP
ncbi:MAG: hypothetical protein HZB50_08780 [Chloroflexi bacterium]|nr:hypothetical protein [Chloroflexota bacterium]